MRDLTESFLRFGWALSVFGAQQAIHLATPRRGWDEAERGLDTVRGAAEREIQDTLKPYYRAGNYLQEGFLDTVERFFKGTWSEPGKLMNETWETLDRTRARVREALAEEEETTV